jgi:peptidoglycan-associated lipoprotein
MSRSAALRPRSLAARACPALLFVVALAVLGGCATTKYEDGKYDAEFDKRLETLGKSYESLDAKTVSGNYSNDTFAHAFEIPRNWDTSGEEHELTVEKRLTRLSALKWEPTDKMLAWKRGRHRWFTHQGVRVTETLKDGRVAEFEGHHSAMWEERDGRWVIAHEHFGGSRDHMFSTFKTTPETAPPPPTTLVQTPPPPPPPIVTPPSEGPSEAEQMQAKGIPALADIFYDFDRAEVRPDQQSTIEKNAAVLKANPGLKVTIEGHCDERGTRAYNMALGWRRAEAAKEALVALGIDAGRMKTVSYGKERPFVPGHSEESWSKNRRAHFVEFKARK